MKTETKKFLEEVNGGNTEYGIEHIIDLCDEWISEGWRIDMLNPPTAPMYAAALFNEAAFQDECCLHYGNIAEYPQRLRKLAHRILEIEGHSRYSDEEIMVLHAALVDFIDGENYTDAQSVIISNLLDQMNANYAYLAERMPK